jgi:hypothetical protein
MKRVTFDFTPERYARLEETAKEAGHEGKDPVKELMISLLKQHHVNHCTMKAHQERETAMREAQELAMADVSDM